MRLESGSEREQWAKKQQVENIYCYFASSTASTIMRQIKMFDENTGHCVMSHAISIHSLPNIQSKTRLRRMIEQFIAGVGDLKD